MEHVVFFPAQDGSPAFRRVGSLEDAVRLVEHLRNVEGVHEVSCHALTEVPLAFRAYYRVEVPALLDAAAAAVAAAVDEPPLLSAAVQVMPDPFPGSELPASGLPAHEPVGDEAGAEHVPTQTTTELLPEPAMTAVNGHSGDGATSLGFFA